MEDADAMIGTALRRACAIAGAAVLMGVAPAHGQPSDWMKAPNVELRSVKGQRVRIADFIGHTYEGFDKDTDAAYRREIAALLAEP